MLRPARRPGTTLGAVRCRTQRALSPRRGRGDSPRPLRGLRRQRPGRRAGSALGGSPWRGGRPRGRRRRQARRTRSPRASRRLRREPLRPSPRRPAARGQSSSDTARGGWRADTRSSCSRLRLDLAHQALGKGDHMGAANLRAPHLGDVIAFDRPKDLRLGSPDRLEGLALQYPRPKMVQHDPQGPKRLNEQTKK